MKPAPFAYRRPATLDEAQALLAETGDEAKILAGGQSLIPLMNFRLSRPAMLIDLGAIEGLDRLEVGPDGELLIGAMTRQSVVERSATVDRGWPILPEALRHVGHVQIRNRGTVGGSLAHADPAAELPALAVATDARIRVASVRGPRIIEADAFFTGPFTTDLAPDEILLDIRLPALDKAAFAEAARRHGDFALGGVIAVKLAGAVRLVAFGLGWTPVRLFAAEAIVAHGAPDDHGIFADAAAAARDEIDPLGDIHADVDYRRDLIEALLKDVLPVVLS